ncbi:hypothetical protein [Gilvibacter sp.]|uniref:coiled-coil domain-containing protein n=1 Tax=Gilvibacter sp. TaxID=2729997 RepID=UPI0025C18D48|nr:hypothetical protein [Gilvibacter sp.]NQX77869.1 hypothetical protein [Gilvibacter sp.]
MRIITYSTAVVIWLLATVSLSAQDANDAQAQIDYLQGKIEAVQTEEKEALKDEVIAINDRLDKGEITEDEATQLKQEAAEKRALNIENRVVIIQNQIDLLERNGSLNTTSTDNFELVVFSKGKVLDFDYTPKERKYDRRTTSDLVLAFGLNNAITEGESFGDTDFKIAGSRFFELGWAWKTRVFKNSNWLRFKYGFSFQFNGLKLTDDRFFEDTGTETVVREFGASLDKSKLRNDYLVFPMHFEFGPSRKIEKENYFRYSTRNKLKVGLGGYAGFRLRTVQKLRFDGPDGNEVEQKQTGNFNTNNFAYGLSGYIGWTGMALYVKYDLNPIFKDNPVEQRNISVGLRFDVD